MHCTENVLLGSPMGGQPALKVWFNVLLGRLKNPSLNASNPHVKSNHMNNLSNTRPDAKFRALVHFFIEQSQDDPNKLGTIRLNKALWFTDVFYYLATGEQMTESTYVRRKYGPVPERVLPVLWGLEAQGTITIREPAMPFDTRHFLINNKADEFDGLLSEAEKDFAKIILDSVRGYSANELSELTHDDVWRDTPDGEEMSVRDAAMRIHPPIFSREELDEIGRNVEASDLGLKVVRG